MPFRFRRRGMSPRRVGAIARRATGRILVKRVVANGLTIPDITSVDFDNGLVVPLLECTETMDEEVESDGTAVADAPLYSKILSIKLQGIVHAATASVLRWTLFKSPDADITLSNLATSWHNSNDTQAERELRKMTIAKGMFFMGASNQGVSFRTFVRRKALARVANLSEGDVLRLVIAKDAAGTTIPLELWGSIYVRANA